MELIKPKALGKGSTIGLVAPALYLDEDALDKGVKILENMGYKTKVHPHCHLRHYNRAGTAEQRGQAVNDMFADPDVDGILCVRGGDGFLRTEQYLDYDIIKNNPKVFCGFSSATFLLHSFLVKTGLVTYHGPALIFILKENTLGLSHFNDVLSGHQVSVDIPAPKLMQKGVGTGPLIGGNISNFVCLMGTPYEPDTDGAILFLEDIYDWHHTYVRFMWHLKHVGKLENLAGIVIGEMIDVGSSYDRRTGTGDGVTIWDSIMELCAEQNIPIVGNVPIGHGDCTLTLPLGIEATLRVTDNNASLTLEEPATLHP